mgnify:CR=1 FL=1
MEGTITITKDEMNKVFNIWNKECNEKPEDFIEDTTETEGKTFTETFLDYLDKIRS